MATTNTKKKTTTKATTPKKATAKRATKTKPKVPKTVAGSLTKSEIKILEALKSAGTKELNRDQLIQKTGINNGWSRMLGTPTTEVKPGTLQGRKLINCHKHEGSRVLTYTITTRGKQALSKA
jgi:hypothetical protein